MSDISEIFQWIVLGFPAFVIAGSVHEYMHAWSAKKLGDYTATASGRLTLNPLAHLDPVGTILLVLFRFGWMKPVPVNEYNFEHRERDMALTAAAGPASNLVMAVAAAIIYRILFASFGLQGLESFTILFLFIETFIWVNLMLLFFNLLPIPPLDGYRIVRAFLPKQTRFYWEQLERYSIIIFVVLFLPISPLSGFISIYLVGSITYAMGLLL